MNNTDKSYETFLENRIKELEKKVKTIESQQKKVPEHYTESSEKILLNE